MATLLSRDPPRGGLVPELMENFDDAAMRRTSDTKRAGTPDGAGFARVSVIDANGASDSVLVRLE